MKPRRKLWKLPGRFGEVVQFPFVVFKVVQFFRRPSRIKDTGLNLIELAVVEKLSQSFRNQLLAFIHVVLEM